jgi:cation transport regulator ChaC
MGKGGPLAFLNKKPWHPLNARNQEDTWKREQAFMAEVEKREHLKKHIEEEREKEDFSDFVAKATKQKFAPNWKETQMSTERHLHPCLTSAIQPH